MLQLARPQKALWGMRLACWIPKESQTQHVQYLLHFPCNNGCTNPPHCRVTRALSVLVEDKIVSLTPNFYPGRLGIIFEAWYLMELANAQGTLHHLSFYGCTSETFLSVVILNVDTLQSTAGVTHCLVCLGQKHIP
jgi:hypothetical protein